jgi:alpha-L-fucosidase
VERKSKNGVTLLSLAPKADGTLPPSQIHSLKEIGKWMAVNKEALYAARPVPYAGIGMKSWKAGTIRFTSKGQYLYAIELGNEILEVEEADQYTVSRPPKAPYTIPGVKPVQDSEIRLLGSDETLLWHQEGKDVVIESLPDPLPGDYAWSFKIRIK